MKRIKLLLVAMLSLAFGWAYGDEPRATLDEICFKTWQLNLEGKSYYSQLYFDRENKISTFFYDGKSYPVKYPFYLSDEVEKEFDEKKIGKVNSGHYIIVYNTKAGTVHVYEIKNITDTSLQIHVVKDDIMATNAVTYHLLQE